ncbi:uncharacterized protein F5891DRAFT_981835 [Suillus fuscotomentosus]|uniref:NAD-dependent epimerase/dehydratase domain-containing protein n=1 Tax=Suillus fuscotomentosus TaxID=1912939 RepID=A0AAD4HJH0_9AGAM|nr:uncharacterized protein F5891DRAFT_981835 [Suillus fuscotomentosus]KAG1898436.1 hypothetical protein F5891DRAFT_981835 [Suillus fuscotomentosus]
MQFVEKMQIHIAWFHNIFGPYGTWVGGHEKVPAAAAAQLRKALAAYMDPTTQHEIEFWGDAKQQRSFLYINNCVEVILLLLESDCSAPINIGSDCSVTIDDENCRAICRDVGDVHFRYMDDIRPVGIHSCNSNNEFIMKTLCWTPKITLEASMMKTVNWIRGEMEKMLHSTGKTA